MPRGWLVPALWLAGAPAVFVVWWVRRLWEVRPQTPAQREAAEFWEERHNGYGK
jgi:hypothetical protein